MITSSNTETGLAEVIANGTTTKTTSNNEAVALVTSWLEQHPDRKIDFLVVQDDRHENHEHNVIPYRLVYAPGTSTTTTKTTTTNTNATVIERTTEIETMQYHLRILWKWLHYRQI